MVVDLRDAGVTVEDEPFPPPPLSSNTAFPSDSPSSTSFSFLTAGRGVVDTEATLEELTRALVVDWVDVEGNVVDCVVEAVDTGVDSLLEALEDMVGGRNIGGRLL